MLSFPFKEIQDNCLFQWFTFSLLTSKTRPDLENATLFFWRRQTNPSKLAMKKSNLRHCERSTLQGHNSQSNTIIPTQVGWSLT